MYSDISSEARMSQDHPSELCGCWWSSSNTAWSFAGSLGWTWMTRSGIR